MTTHQSKRLQQTQAQVDEVVDIMRVNVDKVLERDQKLSELDDRAVLLNNASNKYEKTAKKLQLKYFWKSQKMTIILVIVVLIIVAIIIVYLALKFS